MKIRLRLHLYRARAIVRPMPPAPAAHRPLRPLVCHPGGKAKALGVLLPRIPEHRTFVDLTFGGGSVFWAKPRSPKEVVNDLDRALMSFYRRLNCPKLRRCVRAMVRIGKDTEAIRRAWAPRARRMAAGSSNSCDVFIGKTYGYGCKSGRPSFAPASAVKHKGAKKILGRCEDYKERLKRVTVLSQDYRKVARRYDAPDTFFLIDPPWLNADGAKENGQYYREDSTNPETVCSFLRTLKGKFLLQYDDHPRIRKACAGFRIESVPWITSMAQLRGVDPETFPDLGLAGAIEKRMLLISNYELAKKR
mgnify:CR=1 FL=1